MELTNYYEEIIKEYIIFDNTKMIITNKNVKFTPVTGGYIELSTMLYIYEQEDKISTFLNILMDIYDQLEEHISDLPVANVIHDIL